jgi:hypothetical protein
MRPLVTGGYDASKYGQRQEIPWGFVADAAPVGNQEQKAE